MLRANASNTDVPTSVASSKKEVKMENNEYVGTCMLIRRNEYTIPSLKTWVAPEIMLFTSSRWYVTPESEECITAKKNLQASHFDSL